MFTTPAMQAAVSDRAWLQAMLDVEAALATAAARVGLVPQTAAAAIAVACMADRFDVDGIGRAAVASISPAVPLVEALKRAVPAEAAPYVHLGATSQDIIDTAAMLIVRRALQIVLADLDGVAAACAGLAERHRSTVMAGRTLLQQAVPITFGLKAAGWLTAVTEARAPLVVFSSGRLALQLGGAAGTLAAFGSLGLAVSREMAAVLDLAEPALPWHTNRTRIAELGAALAIVAGVMGKIALDVSLLMQTEVGEAFEPSGDGRGRSSAMPHKRNPAGAVAVNAAMRRAQAQAGVLIGSLVQEHERAAGAWQAEWQSISELFELIAVTVARVHEILDGIEIDSARMRDNLAAAGGFAMAERVTIALAEHTGREAARISVQRACEHAAKAGQPLRDALLQEGAITACLSPNEVDKLLDPDGYLGATGALIDRALAAHGQT